MRKMKKGGREEGRKEGREEGREEGRKEGRRKGGKEGRRTHLWKFHLNPTHRLNIWNMDS